MSCDVVKAAEFVSLVFHQTSYTRASRATSGKARRAIHHQVRKLAEGKVLKPRIERILGELIGRGTTIERN
jgi:hypothetical protein